MGLSALQLRELIDGSAVTDRDPQAGRPQSAVRSAVTRPRAQDQRQQPARRRTDRRAVDEIPERHWT